MEFRSLAAYGSTVEGELAPSLRILRPRSPAHGTRAFTQAAPRQKYISTVEIPSGRMAPLDVSLSQCPRVSSPSPLKY